jgi:hypothetical protein
MLDGKQPCEFFSSFESYSPTSFPYKFHNEIPIGGESFLLLSVLSETAQSQLYLATNSLTLETAIVKFTRPGVGGDVHGCDCSDRLKDEFHILSALSTYNIAPQPLGWSDGLWPALAVEDIRGERLSELSREERIAALPNLAHAVAQLHKAGFVHADIKLENAIRLNNRVFLIDFELATPIGAPSRRGGTRGHLAPEIDDAYINSPARDIYALAGCLFQAFMDIPPGLLDLDSNDHADLLRNQISDSAAKVFELLATPDPASRPNAEIAVDTLVCLVGNLGIDADIPPNTLDSDWCLRAGFDGARATGSFAENSEDVVCWRNSHFQREFKCEAIHIGAAGILLGLISIDTSLKKRTFDKEIAGGARWLANATPKGKSAGLFTGNAGVALTLALASRRLDEKLFADAARDRLITAATDRREIDFFSGSAGVLYTCCLLREILNETWPLEHAVSIANELLSAVHHRNGIPVWGNKTGTASDYLGCAHGSAGFALALASYGRLANEPHATSIAHETFTAIYHAGRNHTGALRMSLQTERHHAVGNWCHGVAGYLWAILLGLEDDPGLSEEIDGAVKILCDSPAIGTATYCHGLAGQLELWNTLSHYSRFEAVANTQIAKCKSALKILQREIDGLGVWGSDDPDIITPDLWIGFLGPATALAMHASGSRNALLSKEWLVTCAHA